MSMYKYTYTININRDDMENFDPNLEKAIGGILQRKFDDPSGFDYEIVFLYEGYASNSRFNSCFNVFLHDMTDSPNGYFYPKSGDDIGVVVNHVKEFILGFHNKYKVDIANTDCAHMDVFKSYTSKTDGNKYTFSTLVDIPRDRLCGDLSILQYEPDFLICVVPKQEDLFKFVLCKYYYRLYESDLLDHAELRDLSTIRIGFH